MRDAIKSNLFMLSLLGSMFVTNLMSCVELYKVQARSQRNWKAIHKTQQETLINRENVLRNHEEILYNKRLLKKIEEKM